MRVESRQCSVSTIQACFDSSRKKVSMTTRITRISLVRIVDSYLGDAHKHYCISSLIEFSLLPERKYVWTKGSRGYMKPNFIVICGWYVGLESINMSCLWYNYGILSLSFIFIILRTFWQYISSFINCKYRWLKRVKTLNSRPVYNVNLVKFPSECRFSICRNHHWGQPIVDTEIWSNNMKFASHKS